MVNILARFFGKKDISVKMRELYDYINTVSIKLDKKNQIEVGKKVSIKDFSRWYSKKVKEYENIINEAEQNVGLKSVCEKGCSACCKQAIYINPAEYSIIEKYVKQLGYDEKEKLKLQVRAALDKLKQVDIPMKVVDGSQEEQDRVNEIFFSLNICCPFLSQENECMIYEIRPCICWNYRNYKDKSECQVCYKPSHSCAFVDLDKVMAKEMYNLGWSSVKHQEYYLLIDAVRKMLSIR